MAVSPTMLVNMQNPLESDMSTGVPYNSMDHHIGLARVVDLPKIRRDRCQMPKTWHASLNLSYGRGRARMTVIYLPNKRSLQLKGSTIRMSNVYSQGLLSSLADALQSSGIDLSQANISIQIDLGKRATSSRPITTMACAKG
ncbi:uncharacterized protein LOC143885845 [Tasmannia lanceolata]|uniref:uncharacterized protein LOC143885845 n=1 Tax=Tasmannia lanceolata TaxID=3420 RepID=UPI0040631E57